MNSELPATAQLQALHADITTTRAELGRTLEAIAAKTHVKTRAKQAARETLGEVRGRVSVRALQARTDVATWWQRLRGMPARKQLSVAAVLVGALSATAALVGFRGRGGDR